MLPPTDTQSFTDFASFSAMRKDAREDPQATLQAVAKQFESIYINMMLKSMRDASFGDPLFDSNNSDMYRDMYDNQIAIHMSQQGGIGLADMLVKQLQKNPPNAELPAEQVETLPVTERVMPTAQVNPANSASAKIDPLKFDSQQQFVETLMPYAESAAQELGVSPQVLIAQAALETGWGNAVQKLPNGRSSYNLFNIKADPAWHGQKLHVNSLEYVDGVARKEKSAFRVYDNYAQSFADYVKFIQSSPRYEQALQVAENPQAYAKELQQAGYATDPVYADKVINIMQRNIISAPLSEYMLEG